jgi:hypothetical protein
MVGRFTAAGDYDTTFGDVKGSARSGVSELGFGGTLGTATNFERFNATALDSAGNVIAVGNTNDYAQASVARFKGSDGTPDTTFATTGGVAIDLGGSSQSLNSVLIDSSGRIVAAGTSSDGTLLVQRVRFDATGNRDASFGKTAFRAPGYSVYGALTADDQLVVANTVYRSGTTGPVDLVVSRFWP